MSSNLMRENGVTELRLDYNDLSSGQLVIVIQGLPSSDGDSFSPSSNGSARTSTAAQNGNRHGRTASSQLLREVRAIDGAGAYAPVLVTSLVLAGWRGQEARASELIAAMIEDAPIEYHPRATALADYARAVLYNGLGRYQDALAAGERACAREDFGAFAWALLELVEAGARSSARAAAAAALGRLDERTRAVGSDWALGVRARSAALLSEGVQAERLYRDAIELLSSSRTAVHLARAQLVYGEWLRRENRRVDARLQLRAAVDSFSCMGLDAFAGRAQRELLATGESARKRTDETRDCLTPQEAQIARLARDGFSNPEIGTQLFISPRTVQYHLRKVFQKLGINSRNQLGRVASERLAA